MYDSLSYDSREFCFSKYMVKYKPDSLMIGQFRQARFSKYMVKYKHLIC